MKDLLYRKLYWNFSFVLKLFGSTPKPVRSISLMVFLLVFGMTEIILLLFRIPHRFWDLVP